MPQEVLQNERWECPKCLKMCNCGACRRLKNGNVPYQPRNTLLGHDTRPIADDRSVETLVDFKVHNLNWLKTSGDDGRSVQSKRLQKLQQQAEAEKAKNADDVHIEVPALQNGEQAAGTENPDDALQQSIADGLGEGQERPDVEMNGTSTEQPSAPQPAGPAEVADMSIAPEDQDQSAYPDPDLFGQERMLGMGYYQQDDDSPDKILFDPYQRPTAEDYVVDEEPELMSEYLKKQLRLAKRRARHAEDDDPDFAAPRSHHRKKQKLDKPSSQAPPTRDGQEDALENMDPALFDQTMPDIAGDIRAGSAQAGPSQPENAQPADEAGEKSGGQRLYPANVPTLRHARPKISYRVDEDNEEEFNDILIPRSQRPEYRAAAAPANVVQSIEGPTGPKDPLDLASAAVLAITGGGGNRSNEASQEPKSARAAATPSGPSKLRGPHKKRGRPPGRPRKSEAHQTEDEEMHEAPEPPKRRGRPPRRSMAATDAEDSDHNNDSDIDAQLAQELDGFDDNGDVVERNEDAPQVPKRRGRPPKNGVKKVAEEATTRAPLLSLAERMKLKGKKFKIGERKSTSGTPGKVVAKPAPVDSIEESSSPAVSGRGTRGAGKETSLPVRESPRTTRTRTTSITRQSVQPADEESHHSESERDEPEAEKEQEKDKSPEPARRSVSQASVRISPPRDEASPSKSPEPERTPSASASPEPSSRAPSAPSVTRISPSPSPSPVRSPSPPPPPPKPAGPTVVRLMDTEDEESDYGGGSYQSGSRSPSQMTQSERSRSGSEAASGTGSEDESSSDSDSDDEDIPARKESVRQSFTASRGRGGVGVVSRGRGGIRGRGRGRGRPRGS